MSKLVLCTFHMLRMNVEVSWYWCIHLTLTLTETGFKSYHRHALLSSSKTKKNPDCCSRPVYKWGPSRMRQMIVFEFASAIITGC